MLTKEQKKELIRKFGPETASVLIGQNGLTDSISDEIKSQLKVKKSIKVSLPHGVEDRGAMAEEICTRTGAELVDLRGRKVILHKD